MSTDFNVVNHTKKTWWHLGQRMAMYYSFGYATKDPQGQGKAAFLIHENLGDDLRIVDTDEIPDGYQEIDLDGIE